MTTERRSDTRQYIVFMGPPASGKGTQASLLASVIGLPVIVTGEMLRRSAAAGTPAGLEAKVYMDSGALVPDEVLFRLVSETLGAEPAQSAGAILDGFPRNLAQAEYLDNALAAMGGSLTAAVYIAVPDEELVRRQAGRLVCRLCGKVYNQYSLPPLVAGQCECGGELYQRSDDSESTIRRRLEVYAESTAPLADYYRARGLLRTIDGLGGLQQVQARIEAALSLEPAL